MEDKYCHLIEKPDIYDGDYPVVDFKYVTSCCEYEFDAYCDDKYELKDLKFCPICGREINHEEDEYIPETKCKHCFRTSDGTQKLCGYYFKHGSCWYDELDKQEEERQRKQYEELKKKFGY